MGEVTLKNKRVLITGGNGYLGRYLIQRLVELKAFVFSIDIQEKSANDKITYYQVDLRNVNELKTVIHKIKPDFIYHLAATLDRTRDFDMTNAIFDINVNGTVNLLNAINDIEYENLIFTSTSEVYGGSQIKPPFKEDCNFVPASPYSLSKNTAEMAIRTFSEIYHKNFTILRLFNFYGSDMPKNFFIPQLIDKLKKNEDFDMTAGEQKRDILHISDIVKSLVLATNEKAFRNVFNVCSGNAKSIKELALELKKVLNSKSTINFGALPYRVNEVWEMVGDNSKFFSEFGFKPKFIVDVLKQEFNI